MTEKQDDPAEVFVHAEEVLARIQQLDQHLFGRAVAEVRGQKLAEKLAEQQLKLDVGDEEDES